MHHHEVKQQHKHQGIEHVEDWLAQHTGKELGQDIGHAAILLHIEARQRLEPARQRPDGHIVGTYDIGIQHVVALERGEHIEHVENHASKRQGSQVGLARQRGVAICER